MTALYNDRYHRQLTTSNTLLDTRLCRGGRPCVGPGGTPYNRKTLTPHTHTQIRTHTHTYTYIHTQPHKPGSPGRSQSPASRRSCSLLTAWTQPTDRCEETSQVHLRMHSCVHSDCNARPFRTCAVAADNYVCGRRKACAVRERHESCTDAYSYQCSF